DPNGFNSAATGVAGDQIVGYSTDIHGAYHALLWTSRGLVDLSPNGFGGSLAFGTDGIHQVGSGSTGGQDHALLWSASASSAVDLHPAGYMRSFAQGVSGGQQVGAGVVSSGRWHALLWTGSAASVVDLNP